MKIPKNIKIKIKLILRLINDLINGTFFNFSKKRKTYTNFEYSINLAQEIKLSRTFENKIFNLSLAAEIINEYVIFPNEIFSFWQVIGNPSLKFKKARSIKNGNISDEEGGGLCQVSGIIYQSSLIAGLKIIERFNHSIDIYTEETRFTPLGTDATVVYGYKDLRVKNIYSFPIKFHISIVYNAINLKLLSTEKINENNLNFESEDQNDVVIVKVISNDKKILNISEYKKNWC